LAKSYNVLLVVMSCVLGYYWACNHQRSDRQRRSWAGNFCTSDASSVLHGGQVSNDLPSLMPGGVWGWGVTVPILQRRIGSDNFWWSGHISCQISSCVGHYKNRCSAVSSAPDAQYDWGNCKIPAEDSGQYEFVQKSEWR